MTLTNNTLVRKFNEFNALYFNGELKMPTFEVSKTKRALGDFNARLNRIRVSTYYNRTEEEFYQTLVHEMIHLWQWQTYRKADHKATFRSKAQKIKELSHGRFDITRCTSVNAECVREENVNEEHLLIAKCGNIYKVGRVSASSVDNIARWLREQYYKNLVHYIAKGKIISKMTKCHSRFSYCPYNELAFDTYIAPCLIKQVKVCSFDGDKVPLVDL